MNFDDVFPTSALDDNRAGRLTPQQKQRWEGRSRAGRKSELSFALIAVIIGTLVLIGAKKSVAAYEHYGVPALCYVIAAVLVVVSATGRDKITEDVRDGRLESVEGAITKRIVRPVHTAGQNQAPPRYYFDVEGGSYETGSKGYQVAPDAGIVRVYYLPKSRWVVNLELLPDRPIPAGQTPIDTVKDLGSAWLRRDEVGRADARAEMAAFGHVFEAATHQPDTPPPPGSGQGDPRPLAQAIVGTWSNQLATVTFGADGSLTVAGMMGLPISQTGHWSIDAEGRLTADALQLMGPGGKAFPQGKHEDKHHHHDQPSEAGPTPGADAWVTGDNLTIHFGEYTLTFQRQGAPAPS